MATVRESTVARVEVERVVDNFRVAVAGFREILWSARLAGLLSGMRGTTAHHLVEVEG